jgi:hypothetical protein
MSRDSKVEPTCPIWKMKAQHSRSFAASIAAATCRQEIVCNSVPGVSIRASRKLARV